LSSKLFEHRYFWISFIVAFISAFVVLVKVRKNKAKSEVLPFVVFVFGTILLYSSTIILNSRIDNSPIFSDKATIITKKISRGRHTDYFLYFVDDKSSGKARKIHVDSIFFKSVAVGDSMSLQWRKGYLGLPWVVSYKR